MLTRDQIKNNLKQNPLWEPDEGATYQEWEIFDEVYDEMEAEGTFDTEEKNDIQPSNKYEEHSNYKDEDVDSNSPDDDDDVYY